MDGSFDDDARPSGRAELIVDAAHFDRVVRRGMLRAVVSLDIATADFKAMLVPDGGSSQRSAPSIVRHLVRLAERGVEVRVLHSGVPSSAALHELRGRLPDNLMIRRCPRLHAKAVVVDAYAMYLGSANLTGAGLGAKGETRRNIEWGIWTESPPLIDGVLQQFNALWEGDRCADCGRRDVCPVPLEMPRL
ncbi:MAG: phospholipase D family protein [Phycisphaeraceae bacterium]